MYNVQARGVTVPNAVIGMACFVGGLAQFAAGMWGMSPSIFTPKDTID
jgi:succinate-acetate transporter protein